TRKNSGLVALADIARLESRPEAWHLGFLLGPRINAGGRVGQPDLGSRLLSTDDRAEASEIVQKLDGFNTERREIEALVLEQALAQVEENDMGNQPLIFVSGDGWHPGVIGIVASRLGERYHRPVCVAGIDGDAAKGSGRSVQGIDLGATVIAARQEGLLINGGGHAMAAGFTVARDRMDDLRDFMTTRIAVQQAALGEELGRILYFDGALTPAGASPELVHEINRLAPFGAGNSEPRFVLAGVRIGKADVVGENHVRCFVTGPDGGRIKAMAFRTADRPLGKALLESGGLPIHLAGKLRIDDWMGKNGVQFLIDDAAPAS
ncbi:MAG: single-stranded-DNA-specific exonuclease RecJ, partial [Alphaproteobacteria bacterium]